MSEQRGTTGVLSDFAIWNEEREKYINSLWQLHTRDTRTHEYPTRERSIEIIVNCVWGYARSLRARGITEADCKRMGKMTPREMGVETMLTEVFQNPPMSSKEAWSYLEKEIAAPPAPKVEEYPEIKALSLREKTLLRERGLLWLISEAGYGRSEIVWPKELGERKRMRLVIDALATIIVRSKEEAFTILRDLGPMSREDMLEYDKLAWADALDIEFTDRQIMDVLNPEGEPIHGWEIEDAMWGLVNFYVKLNGVKILAVGKDWTDIEGVKEPVRFLANLRVEYQGRLSFRRSLSYDRRGIEHRYHLWLGGLGLAFFSNLIQDRFLPEVLKTLRRLPPGPFAVWGAVEAFRGSWQHRRLEFFEGVLGLKGTDPTSTQKHRRIVLRAFAELDREGLVKEWGTSGRGRSTVVHFWIPRRPALPFNRAIQPIQ